METTPATLFNSFSLIEIFKFSTTQMIFHRRKTREKEIKRLINIAIYHSGIVGLRFSRFFHRGAAADTDFRGENHF